MLRSRSTGGDYTCQLYFDPRADESDTGGYSITDQELRQKLSNLIDANEKIQNASIYSNPLFKWQPITGWCRHEIAIIETKDWWWSFEKNTKCITIQRSKKLESVRDMYQRKKRTTGFGPFTKIMKNETTKGGNITINELINYFWRTDILNKDYNVVNANCQDFAAMVFNRIKSFECQVYFDEAADQHDNDNIADSTSGFYMTVDKALDEVRRCGGSEPFTKNLECYTLRVPFRQHFCSQLCVMKRLLQVFFFLSSFIYGFYRVVRDNYDKSIFETNEYLSLSYDKKFWFVIWIVIPNTILNIIISFVSSCVFFFLISICTFIEWCKLGKNHIVMIFETQEGTYWSLEGALGILRAKNKDVLLNKCHRHPLCIPSLKDKDPEIVVGDLEWKNMNEVMEYLCKKKKNKNSRHLNLLGIKHISSLYNKIKKKQRGEQYIQLVVHV
ncbi:Uncharacterized protein APZ42_024279 [Daphnia magna]|uniref:PPPDE domain-containing protein n=1 Tax=Daphnia magna TaxID=35525 RepID=A0A164ULN2_9CRUS|nr:Uncharacterized protein APZ42_024279 [Daphnia magna]